MELLESGSHCNSGTCEELALLFSHGDEAKNYGEAITGEAETEWKLAVESELHFLEENKTWEPFILPVGRNAIPVKWIIK